MIVLFNAQRVLIPAGDIAAVRVIAAYLACPHRSALQPIAERRRSHL